MSMATRYQLCFIDMARRQILLSVQAHIEYWPCSVCTAYEYENYDILRKQTNWGILFPFSLHRAVPLNCILTTRCHCLMADIGTFNCSQPRILFHRACRSMMLCRNSFPKQNFSYFPHKCHLSGRGVLHHLFFATDNTTGVHHFTQIHNLAI
jgi:hypothetical protein